MSDPNEVVHFFSVGDWGSQPYQHFPPNGGSMHNLCVSQPLATRCSKESDQWQREENSQRNVMEQMKKIALANPISWVVNVGDNFYFDGVTGTDHWHWKTSFEAMYDDPVFHVPWLSVLGNHDYGGDCCAKDLFGGAKGAMGAMGYGQGQTSVLAQFEYDNEKAWVWPAQKKRRWVMPYFNWTKKMDIGPYKVQYFGIDTNFADASKACFRCGGCTNSGQEPEVLKRGCHPESAPGGQCTCFMSRLFQEQMDWLEAELKTSEQDKSVAWRFVIGHHPWNFIPRSPGGLDRFLHILKRYRVQVHFAGHVHAMRHDVIEDSIHMVMTGSSGGYQYDGGDAPVGDPLGTTLWSSAFLDYGFAHMEMTKERLLVKYINDKGETRKAVVVDASPRYLYQASPWSDCSNSCGQGKHSRVVTCMSTDAGREVPLDVCQQQIGLAKPMTVERCFISARPPLPFCSACGQSSGCTKCPQGFRSAGKTCENYEEVVVVEYEVLVPPSDEWRTALDGLFHALLLNATNMSLSFQSYAVFPKVAHAAAAFTDTSLFPSRVANSRRLGLETYTVTAVVTLSSEDARSVRKALQALRADPGAVQRFPEAGGVSIISIVDISIVCPWMQQADAFGFCGRGQQRLSLLALLVAACFAAVCLAGAAVVVLWKRRGAQHV